MEEKILWHSSTKQVGNASRLWAKDLKLKEGGIIHKVKAGTRAVCWKDKSEVHLPSNMQNPPPSGHFVDEERNASKPLCIESYNKSIGFCGFE